MGRYPKKILLFATFDTKESAIRKLANRMYASGCSPIVIDCGTSVYLPSAELSSVSELVSNEDVLAYVGMSLHELSNVQDKGRAISIMTNAVA